MVHEYLAFMLQLCEKQQEIYFVKEDFQFSRKTFSQFSILFFMKLASFIELVILSSSKDSLLSL